MKTSNTHIAYIDSLKGMTIVMVVVGHIYQFCYGNTESLLFRMLGSYYMYLFLFLSGMVIVTPPNLAKIGRRMMRYMFPSIIIGTLVFSLARGEIVDNWVTYLARRIYYPASGYWYLVSLTIFNIALFPHRMNKKNKLLIDLVLAICWYVIFFLLWKKGGTFGAALCMEHCTCFYPFFMLGHLLRKYDMLRHLTDSQPLFSICLLLAPVLFLMNSENYYIQNISGRFLLPVCCIVVFVYIFSKTDHKESRSIRLSQFLGRNSLDVYLWHFAILYHIHLASVMNWFIETGNMFFEIILALVLGLLISLICVGFGKFIKQSSWIRNIAYGEIAA